MTDAATVSAVRVSRRRPGRSTSSSASRRRSRPVAVKAPRARRSARPRRSSGGAATSDATTNTTAIGKYCWRAEYSGDAFYNALVAHQRGHGVLHDREAAVDDGDDVVADGRRAWFRAPRSTDAATVSGGAGQPTPTGTVDFFLCQPAQVTAGGCEGSAGTQDRRDQDARRGGCGDLGRDHEHDRDRQVLLAGRVLGRRASTTPSSHTNATTECFTTVKQPSTTATTSSPDGRQCGSGHLGRPTRQRCPAVRVSRRRPGRSTSSSASRRRSRPAAVKAPRARRSARPRRSSRRLRRPRTRPPTRPRSASTAGGPSTPATPSTTPSSHTNATTECFTTVKQPSTTATTSTPDGRQRGSGHLGERLGNGVRRRGPADPDRDGRLLPLPAGAGHGRRLSTGSAGTKIGATKTLSGGCGDLGCDHQHDRDRQVLLAGRVLRRRLLQPRRRTPTRPRSASRP